MLELLQPMMVMILRCQTMTIISLICSKLSRGWTIRWLGTQSFSQVPSSQLINRLLCISMDTWHYLDQKTTFTGPEAGIIAGSDSSLMIVNSYAQVQANLPSKCKQRMFLVEYEHFIQRSWINILMNKRILVWPGIRQNQWHCTCRNSWRSRPILNRIAQMQGYPP
jgi:hypothetical protein